MIDAANCKYTPYYCEENAWHLCNDHQLTNCCVVFISNPDRQVPMWFQRAAGPGQPVLWDYHVICAAPSNFGWSVFDLDTTLGFPVSVGRYLSSTFSPRTRSRYLPQFRIVKGKQFLETFSSDRTHMLEKQGTYQHPPPSWPIIHFQDINNLRSFIDMEKPFVGSTMSLENFEYTYVGSQRGQPC